MTAEMLGWVPIWLLFFAVAFVYAAVGHGGASGYLAVMSFFSFPHEQMASSALVLNLLVAGTAFLHFRQAGHFSLKLVVPFLLTSVPLSFLGGTLKISSVQYSLGLSVVLCYAALYMMAQAAMKKEPARYRPISWPIAIAAGAVIGLVSGVIGVGGGIFLSPLILLLRWGNPKETAAASALFIFVNSFSGLMGRAAHGALELAGTGHFLPAVAMAFTGGLLGSFSGARFFSFRALRFLLALVLFLAAAKLLGLWG